LKKGLFFCILLILLGILDLATTVIGTTCFGATEINPLFAGITAASPLMFSSLKLLAIAAIGSIFYKAGSINCPATNRLVQFSYSFALIFMTFVVTNNLIVIAKIV
jgi:Domain of unknown function (DUF5658)